MPTKYTVVQFVPDPIAEERINIGVIAYTHDTVRTRFLRNWERVQRFGRSDIGFLKEFAMRFGKAEMGVVGTLANGADIPPLPALLEHMAGTWVNSIQFTPPRTTLLAPQDFLRRVSDRFLRDEERGRRPFRDRRVAARIAAEGVKAALLERVGDDNAGELLKRKYVILGHLDQHTIDVAVANGKPYFAAHGLSLEVPELRAINRSLESTAWAINDIRQRDPAMPLAVVVLPPREESQVYKQTVDIYHRARHIFEGLNAALVDEQSVEVWAGEAANVTLV